MEEPPLKKIIPLILLASLLIVWGILPFQYKNRLGANLGLKRDTLNSDLVLMQGNTILSSVPPVHEEQETLDVLGYRIITAYSSTPDQTDDTPFITASGQMVRDGIIATNELPMGTSVKIDGKVYEVQDRTNSRYAYRYDIWFPTRQEALDYGRQVKEVILDN